MPRRRSEERPEYAYSLVPRKEEGARADPVWRKRALGRELCPDCWRIVPSWYPRPIDIRLEEWPARSPRDHVWNTGVSLIRSDLLHDLSPFMKSFAIGSCYDKSGKLLADYHTYYMPPWIVLRGEKYADFPTCNTCGAIWLDYRLQRRLFLLRGDFAQHSIRQTSIGQIFVTEAVSSVISESWFKRIRPVRVQLVDIPPDGERLPGDPDWEALQQGESHPK